MKEKISAVLAWILNESTVQSLFYGKFCLVLSLRFYRFVCIWIWEIFLLLNQPRHGQVGKGEAAKQVTLRGLSIVTEHFEENVLVDQISKQVNNKSVYYKNELAQTSSFIFWLQLIFYKHVSRFAVSINNTLHLLTNGAND